MNQACACLPSPLLALDDISLILLPMELKNFWNVFLALDFLEAACRAKGEGNGHRTHTP